MTEQPAASRPSQVTMAGWVALIGSALLLMTIFDSVSRLRTVEFRDRIEEFLDTPPASGLGLEIPEVVEILRVLMFFNGAAAAAATVLAVYVLRRNNAARIGFTVAAVLIVLTAPVGGGFLPVLIAFAAFMLWLRPARDWFAGRPVTAPWGLGSGKASSEDAGDRSPHGESPTWPRMPEDSADRPQPRPTPGFGGPAPESGPEHEPPAQPSGWSYPGQTGAQPPGPPRPSGGPPGGPPYAGQGPSGGPPAYAGPGPYPYAPQQYAGRAEYRPAGYHGAPTRDPEQRPTTVTVAAFITWTLSALAILTFILSAIVMLAAKDQFLDELFRQLQSDPAFGDSGITADDLVAAVWVMAGISLVWGVAAMTFAWFAYRRANWGRIMLVVSSVVTVLFGVVTFPVGILHILGAGAVSVLLFTGGANEWYARSRAPGAAPGQYPGQYGQPPGQYPGQQGQYGQPPGQYPGQQGQYGQPPGQYPGQYAQPPGQYPGQYGQPPGQYPGQQPAQYPGQYPGQPPAQPGQYPGQYGGQPPEPGSAEEPDRRKDEPPPNVW